MAGKKQHFIQKSFVRNFSKEPEAYNPKIWFYRSDNKPYPCGINDAPAAKYFYSELSSSTDKMTLDDEITKYECEVINPCLAILKTIQDAQNVDSKIPATVIAHFIIRNNHFRLLSAQCLSRSACLIEKRFTSKDSFILLLKSYLNSEISSEWGSICDKIRCLPQNEKNILINNFSFLLLEFTEAKKSYYLRRFYEFINCGEEDEGGRNKKDFCNFIIELLEVGIFDSIIEEHTAFMKIVVEKCMVCFDVATIHNEALVKDITGKNQFTELSKMRWVSRAFPNGLILPDCIAICLIGGKYRALLGSDLSEMEAVFFPISSNMLLIGYRGERPPFFENINKLLAENCADFFIASEFSQDLNKLILLIDTVQSQEIGLYIKEIDDRILKGIFFGQDG